MLLHHDIYVHDISIQYHKIIIKKIGKEEEEHTSDNKMLHGVSKQTLWLQFDSSLVSIQLQFYKIQMLFLRIPPYFCYTKYQRMCSVFWFWTVNSSRIWVRFFWNLSEKHQTLFQFDDRFKFKYHVRIFIKIAYQREYQE